MPNRILIPLDVLDETHPVLLKAAQSFPDAECHLLHVVASSATMSRAGAATYATVMAHTEIDAELAAVARTSLAKLGQGEVVTSGQVIPEILHRAESGAFDFILMGTAGRSGLERFFLGSVAEAVVRESPIPVITWRAAATNKPRPVQRILVLQDFSPAAKRALAFAEQHFPHAQIDLVHGVVPGVVEASQGGGTGGLSSMLLAENRLNWLQETKTKLAKLGGGEIVEGDIADIALARAASGDYDLLALGTSAKDTFERLMFGSVAQKVVRNAEIPVLTVR